MIRDILPDGVAASELFADLPDAVLFPEEQAYIAMAVARRQSEFATARHCARTALAALGVPPAALVPEERGAPRWPQGVVGSITHCAGYRAAAVARSTEILTIGIDAEPHDPLPDGVLDAIALPEERLLLAGLARTRPAIHWDRLLFSVKESVYKAWFPLTRLPLGFEDARVAFDDHGHGFTARLAGGNGPREFAGRWLTGCGLVITAIAIPRP
jgi:4'-phosphopantetheinyl transferase EntD